jgi:hypothetical protein
MRGAGLAHDTDSLALRAACTPAASCQAPHASGGDGSRPAHSCIELSAASIPDAASASSQQRHERGTQGADHPRARAARNAPGTKSAHAPAAALALPSGRSRSG